MGALALHLVSMHMLLALGGHAGPLPANPRAPAGDTLFLTLEHARAMAREGSPVLGASRARAEGAAGEAAGERSYPYNPALEVESLGSSREGTASTEARATIEVPWAGQWGLRRGAAAEAREVARRESEDVARRLLARVDAAFFTLQAAERHVEIVREIRRLNERLREAVLREAAEGNVSRMDVNLVTIEEGRARAREHEAMQARLGASVSLATLVGTAADVIVPPAEDGHGAAGGGPGGGGDELARLPADSLVALSLRRRPDLEARRAARREARTRERLATRAAIPNIEIGAMAAWDPEWAGARAGIVLSMPIPTFQRNQADRARAQAEALAAGGDLAALELEATSEVRTAAAGARSADVVMDIYARDVLEPARQNQGLLETAFAEGKIDLPTLLLVRNQLLDAELGYWNAWLARRIALVRLAEVVGLGGDTAAPPRPDDAGSTIPLSNHPELLP